MKKLLLFTLLSLGLLTGCQKAPVEITSEYIGSEISYEDFKDEYRDDFVDQKTGFENEEVLSSLGADSKIYKRAYQRHYSDLADINVYAYFTDRDASEPFYVLAEFSDKTDLDMEVNPGTLVFLGNEDTRSDYVYYNYGLVSKKPVEDEETKEKLTALGFIEDEKVKGYFYINEKLYLFEKIK